MTWLTQIIQSTWRPFIWWVVIAAWEQGVRVRMGKRIKEMGPGFHFRIPFLDRVYVQSTRVRTVTSTGLTATTKDGKTLTISLAVEYAINSTKTVYENMANPDTILRCRVEGSIVDYISRSNIEDATADHINSTLDGVIQDMQLSKLGLKDIKAFLISCAVVRAIRLMNNDYVSSTSMYNIDDGVGERK